MLYIVENKYTKEWICWPLINPSDTFVIIKLLFWTDFYYFFAKLIQRRIFDTQSLFSR